MRTRTLLLVGLLLASTVGAEFGAGRFQAENHTLPNDMGAPEPTIGVSWLTDNVFYHAGSTTFKVTFDAEGKSTFTDVSPIVVVPANLDPLMIVDEDTGRVFRADLTGPCSIPFFSDDEGATWLPGGNMCNGAQLDHQSVGLGPKPIVGNPTNAPQLQNGYYCGQLVFIGCSVSLDGGVTWVVPTVNAASFVLENCGGFHGHWRISRVTGTAFLPVAACGDSVGILVPSLAGVAGTEAAGLLTLTWDARIVEGSLPWLGGFDPSIGISRESGWVYIGQADEHGARIGMSKDEGISWEKLGGAGGANETTWLDIGQFHDPPIVKATFADVQAGDDLRAAYTFIGLEDLDGDGLGNEYADIYSCDVETENRVWYYYAAFTFDGGQSWTVERISDDVVQIGGIWDGGGGNPCRNLLDFNDMDIDSTGRIYVGYADGCLAECEAKLTSGEPLTPGPYTRVGNLYRQTGGFGLFSAHDVDLDGDGTIDAPPTGEEAIKYNQPTAQPTASSSASSKSKDTPNVGIVAVLGAVAVALAIGRKQN